MYIFNTTYLVEIKKYNQWIDTVKPALTEVIIDQLNFESISFLKLLSHQQDPNYITIAVQCRAMSMKQIEQWQSLYEPNYIAQIKNKFGEAALPFSTIMQEI